jgi:adenylate cyclase
MLLTQEVVRKLVAILASDVVGYSLLMADDEEATLRTLTEYRAIMKEQIEGHHGRVVDSPGDALLAEFESPVEAVNCAAEIQRRLAARNDQLAEHRRMMLRIGINLGDVLHKDGALYGDGVNVAARLESLADPGGICISSALHEHVAGKLGVEFEDLGDQEVKNIARPVRAYRALLGRPPARAAAGKAEQTGRGFDRPSIAVLPFDNMSADPDQEFFADGLTEDIITELSRFRELFVIARNSTFTYKGKAVMVQDVARDLGVRYVVEGSVRRAGNRVRVAVQLIEAATASHIWAERYDRDLDDIFALQDELTQAIVATLPGRMEAATVNKIKRTPTDNVAAYDYVIRGKIHHHNGTAEDNAEALRCLDKAIELDPGYAHAHAWKACTLGQAWARGYLTEAEDEIRERAEQALHVAYELDQNDSECHRILAAVRLNHKDFERAAYHQDKGLALNPNHDLLVVQNGELLTWRGHPDEGVDWIERAMRLNPFHPERFWNHLGRALYLARRYTEAVVAFNKLTAPDYTHRAFLAASCAQLGETDAAKTHADEVLAAKPDFTIDTYLDRLPYEHDADRIHHREGLIMAGLPE